MTATCKSKEKDSILYMELSILTGNGLADRAISGDNEGPALPLA